MSKNLLFVFMILLACLFLTGCSGPDDEEVVSLEIFASLSIFIVSYLSIFVYNKLSKRPIKLRFLLPLLIIGALILVSIFVAYNQYGSDTCYGYGELDTGGHLCYASFGDFSSKMVEGLPGGIVLGGLLFSIGAIIWTLVLAYLSRKIDMLNKYQDFIPVIVAGFFLILVIIQTATDNYAIGAKAARIMLFVYAPWLFVLSI